MPLMIGDWLKGTKLMTAQVRGVYVELLIHQWDNGFIPDDMDQLSMIDRDIFKVWDKLKDKFEAVAPGQLQNRKLEEIRAFWSKQKGNGKQGGRPKKTQTEPKQEPKVNPNENPNHNLHNELDIDIDIEEKIKGALDEIYLDQEQIKWPHLDFNFEVQTFCNKVRGSPDDYLNHDRNGIRKAFQYQLRNAKPKKNGKQQTDKGTEHIAGLMEGFKRRNSGAPSG